MSYFLSIETSTEVCSVCLHDDEKIILELHASESYQHTKVLTVLIASLFEQSGLNIGQLSAIAISQGPGSYTGLRVGVSTAKGLCYGLNIPLIGVNTLKAIAYGTSMKYPNKDFYIPMIDARRMEVYAQVFDHEMKAVNEIEAVILTESSFEQFLKSSSVVFGGNGSEKFKSLINKDNIYCSNIVCNASYMAKEVVDKFNNNEIEDLSYFEPMYFKAPNITKSKKNIFS